MSSYQCRYYLRAPSTVWVTKDWPQLVHQTTCSWWSWYLDDHDDQRKVFPRIFSQPTCQHGVSSPCSGNEMIAHPLLLVPVAQVGRARRLELGVLQHVVRSHPADVQVWQHVLQIWRIEDLLWKMNDIHLFSINSASLATLTMWSFMAWESRRPCKVFLFTKTNFCNLSKQAFCRQEYYGIFLHKVITCSYFMKIFVHQIHCRMHIWVMLICWNIWWWSMLQALI